MTTLTKEKTSQLAFDVELLQEVRLYSHPELLLRIQQKLKLSQEDAGKLIEDTKLFLFLCGTRKGSFAPSAIIDECWHNFILFTQDYITFCETYFGRYIHHQPNSPGTSEESKQQIWAHTVNTATSVFGELSKNWKMEKSHADCDGGTTGCQEPPPADCAKN